MADDRHPGSLQSVSGPAGNVGVTTATIEDVSTAQFQIVGCVCAAFIAVCLTAFHSIRAALIIILLLTVVSVLAHARMALPQIDFKVWTLPTVALRIRVDYGIYIFRRVRNHPREGLEFPEAREWAPATSASGVMLKGFALCAGVAIWNFAPLQFQADMGGAVAAGTRRLVLQIREIT